MMWVRWTLPRLRIDQVMMTCLKYLLPISCVLLLGVSLWQVAMPVRCWTYFEVSCWPCRALLLVLAWLVLQGRDDAEPAAGRRRAAAVGHRGADRWRARREFREPRSTGKSDACRDAANRGRLMPMDLTTSCSTSSPP